MYWCVKPGVKHIWSCFQKMNLILDNFNLLNMDAKDDQSVWQVAFRCLAIVFLMNLKTTKSVQMHSNQIQSTKCSFLTKKRHAQGCVTGFRAWEDMERKSGKTQSCFAPSKHQRSLSTGDYFLQWHWPQAPNPWFKFCHSPSSHCARTKISLRLGAIGTPQVQNP